MLSSTAQNLYWMARYIQRAESTARLLEATGRMALTLRSDSEWRSVTAIYGLEEDFEERFRSYGDLGRLWRYMILDDTNPSSILVSIRSARDNAREERNNLTADAWESLNGTWLELSAARSQPFEGFDAPAILDWVRKQCNLIIGALQTTMLRDDAFNFVVLGLFLERADNTARVLDVKYHILLPTGEKVGGAVDYYQWTEVLSCLSAFRTYRRVYRGPILPWRVAELLVLNPHLPRSLHFCQRQIDDNLRDLANAYGTRGEADRLAGEIYSRLRYGRIDSIFQGGLHEHLTEFIEQNAQLSDEISKQFLFD